MSTPPHRPRNRYAPLLLLVAAGAAAYVLIPHVPRERTIEIRLEDPAAITAVDLAWTPAGTTEAVQGGAFRFPAGQAPVALTTKAHLPDGRYDLDLSIDRGAQHEIIHRVIDLGASDHITVRVR